MEIPRQGVLIGMDEAGRGSWAGPVVAAAVFLERGVKLPGLKDSKLLSASQRENLFKIITSSKKIKYGIGFATAKEVDQNGLLQATYHAFQRALENLPLAPDHILIDGRDKFSFPVPHSSIIRGDQKIRSISAASVVAKVTRDHYMENMAEEYPNYGFRAHKGYGTKEHQRALEEYGPSMVHRKSYAPLKKLQWKQEAFL